MDELVYREEILEHWQNPQNFGVMEKPDVVIEQVNPLCGDEVIFYFRLSLSESSWSGNDHDKSACFSQARNRISDLDSIAHSVRSRMTKKNQGNTRGVGFSAKGGPASGGDSPGVGTVIEDVRFTGSGCAISIASASLLSQVIKGKSIDKIAKITGQDVLSLIGGPVAPARLKCAFLGLEAIRKLTS